MNNAKKLICVICLIQIILFSCVTSGELKFNSEEWKSSNDGIYANTRFKMVDNIIRSKILLGKTLEEVIILLGEYDFIFDTNHIRYSLGLKPYSVSILFTGEKVLDIELTDGKVTRVKKNNEYNYPKKDFNKYDWEEYAGARFTMSEDIINKNMLIGKTREEVIELLGEKECTIGDYFIKYYLGFASYYLSIDPQILYITFENDKVIKVIQYES
jgi:hypothetical protein